MDKKRGWEKLYEKYQNGEMDTQIEELETKMTEKTITKEEYSELNKMKKVKENLYKVTNVLALREKLEKQSKSIKEEIDRRKNLQKANAEDKKLQEELDKIDKKRTFVKNEIAKLKEENLEEDEKAKRKDSLDKKMVELDSELAENNQKYIKNQQIFENNKESKSEKLSKVPVEDLQKRAFNIGSKISKCNMVAGNMMKGLSWDAIEVKLDNWTDRKFTSPEKITDKAKEETGKEEIDIDDLSDRIIKATEEQIEGESEERSEEESEEELEESEKGLTRTSKFLAKHPRIAKAVNFVKERWNNVFNKKETEKSEEVEEEKPEKDDFKDYLKKVAEKGLEQTGKEKLEEAKKQAHARETEKFGKDYADKSYKSDEEER